MIASVLVFVLLKNAMPVSFRLELFTSYSLTIFSGEQCHLPPLKCDSAKYSYSCMLTYYRTNVFVVNVWPTNSVLFIYVLTHCVKTIK